jgi:hypothetical protein
MFWLVVLATARMQHDVLLVFCIPAVIVAIIPGFSMELYAWDRFGTLQVLVSPVLTWLGARTLARRYTQRDLLIAIYLVWVVGLVAALLAIGFPDSE